MKLINNSFIDNFASGSGGGVSVGDGMTDLQNFNSKYESNRAYEGGAVSISHTCRNCTFQGLIFSNNFANGLGGAVALTDGSQTVGIIYSNFSNNFAQILGGAIYVGNNNNKVLLLLCFFDGNKANFYGGSVYVSQYNIEIIMAFSNFFDNHAGEFGGGIHIDIRNHNISIAYCYFLRQIAKSGGAIYFGTDNTRVSLTNCLFKNNNAYGGTGGAMISIQSNQLHIESSHFNENRAFVSGGAIALNGGHVNTLIIKCSFTSNNVTSGDGGAFSTSSLDSFSNSSFHSCMFRTNFANGIGGAIVIFNSYGITFLNTSFDRNIASEAGTVKY